MKTFLSFLYFCFRSRKYQLIGISQQVATVFRLIKRTSRAIYNLQSLVCFVCCFVFIYMNDVLSIVFSPFVYFRQHFELINFFFYLGHSFCAYKVLSFYFILVTLSLSRSFAFLLQELQIFNVTRTKTCQNQIQIDMGSFKYIRIGIKLKLRSAH